MPGSVDVSHDGGVIVATYVGEMDMALLNEGNERIRKLLEQTRARRILFDTLQMADASIELAMEMRRFAGQASPLLDKAATLVQKATTAFMARAAFAFTKSHRVFYRERDAALQWLRE